MESRSQQLSDINRLSCEFFQVASQIVYPVYKIFPLHFEEPPQVRHLEAMITIVDC
jgi:hypothetical protein